jgi:hypothetical protein
MATERQVLDVTDNPELARVAREVQQSRTPCILQADGEALAVIRPLARRSRLPRGKGTSPEDPFWQLTGIAATGLKDHGSERVDEILADFETDKHFSYTDATSFVIIQRFGNHAAFTFDENFRQYGLQVLTP